MLDLETNNGIAEDVALEGKIKRIASRAVKEALIEALSFDVVKVKKEIAEQILREVAEIRPNGDLKLMCFTAFTDICKKYGVNIFEVKL